VGRRVGQGKSSRRSGQVRGFEQKIGLLGGTFDPPHHGHLWLAESSRQQLDLDKVLFLPVGHPPHKGGQAFSSPAHRIQMVELAIQGVANFLLDTTDIDRPPPHSTVTLIPLLRAMFPEAQLWLLVGADSVRDLGSWYLPEKLIAMCRLAVLPRPGVNIDWPSLKASVTGVEQSVDLLDGPCLDISSSEIRQRVNARLTIRYLVPWAVGSYIEENQLYR